MLTFDNWWLHTGANFNLGWWGFLPRGEAASLPLSSQWSRTRTTWQQHQNLITIKVMLQVSVPPSSSGSSTRSFLLQSTTHRVKSSLGEARYNITKHKWTWTHSPLPISSEQEHGNGLVVIRCEVCALGPRFGRLAKRMVATVLKYGTETGSSCSPKLNNLPNSNHNQISIIFTNLSPVLSQSSARSMGLSLWMARLRPPNSSCRSASSAKWWNSFSAQWTTLPGLKLKLQQLKAKHSSDEYEAEPHLSNLHFPERIAPSSLQSEGLASEAADKLRVTLPP